MSQLEASAVLAKRKERSQSYWMLSWRRLLRKKVAVLCLSVIILMYGAGIFSAAVAPYGYNDQNLANAKQGPSLSHPFGTDRLGRDIFTRIIYGLRTTVIITVVALVTGSLVLGITLGLVAGYFEKWIGSVIMRVGEVSASFPDILLVLIVVATVKPRFVDWVRHVEDATGIEGNRTVRGGGLSVNISSPGSLLLVRHSQAGARAGAASAGEPVCGIRSGHGGFHRPNSMGPHPPQCYQPGHCHPLGGTGRICRVRDFP